MEENDGLALPSPSRTHHSHSASGSGLSSTTSGTNLKAKKGKRTKTGCLTCRKRRIKCGEEKPICANCIKSKRNCEGYNQPIVWKSHTEGWATPYSPIAYQSYDQFGGTSEYTPGNIFSTVPAQRHYGIPLDEYGNQIPMTPHITGPMGLSTTQYDLPAFLDPSHQVHENGFGQFSPSSTNMTMSVDGTQSFLSPLQLPQMSPLSPNSFHHPVQNPPQSFTLPFHPSPTPHNVAPHFINQHSTPTPPATARPLVSQDTGEYFTPQHPETAMDVDSAPKLEEINLSQVPPTSWHATENGSSHRRSLNRQFQGT
jgi:hypothetical protein